MREWTDRAFRIHLPKKQRSLFVPVTTSEHANSQLSYPLLASELRTWPINMLHLHWSLKQMKNRIVGFLAFIIILLLTTSQNFPSENQKLKEITLLVLRLFLTYPAILVWMVMVDTRIEEPVAKCTRFSYN